MQIGRVVGNRDMAPDSSAMDSKQHAGTRGIDMSNKEKRSQDIVNADTADAGAYLAWDSVPDRGRGAERILLIQDESIYAEDLVKLGIAWQEFSSLVVRRRS